MTSFDPCLSVCLVARYHIPRPHSIRPPVREFAHPCVESAHASNAHAPNAKMWSIRKAMTPPLRPPKQRRTTHDVTTHDGPKRRKGQGTRGHLPSPASVQQSPTFARLYLAFSLRGNPPWSCHPVLRSIPPLPALSASCSSIRRLIR